MAIAVNSSFNNKEIEVERPSTPTNSPDKIYYNLKIKNRTPPTPSKKLSNNKKHIIIHNIEENNKKNSNKQLIIQEETTQEDIIPTIFSSLYTSLSNMGKSKNTINNKSSISNINNNNQKIQKNQEK